ncbi:MAG TPA: hypothetical protein VFS09_08600 [Candidatus Eisenbacteria bacterium]|nr:hypothetical protein [Candidatus Eisenbacteria bacterium]
MQPNARRTLSRIGIAIGVVLALASLGCSHTVRRPLASILSEPTNRLETPEGDKVSGFETRSQEVRLDFGRARVEGDSLHIEYSKLVPVTNPYNVRSMARVPADTTVANMNVTYLWLDRFDAGGTVGLLLLAAVTAVGLFASAMNNSWGP